VTIDDEMSVDINTNNDLETLINLLPLVVETLKKKGKIETWIKFNQLLSTDSASLDNIAF
jgi:type I site-specific restriction-modification system R (restriction) subunit